jgi:hypothetical protein
MFFVTFKWAQKARVFSHTRLEAFGRDNTLTYWVHSQVTRNEVLLNMASGTVFTKRNFLCNLRMSTISQSVLLDTRAEKLVSEKHSSLLGPFVSYEENE